LRVCRLQPRVNVPGWSWQAGFVTQTLSLLARTQHRIVETIDVSILAFTGIVLFGALLHIVIMITVVFTPNDADSTPLRVGKLAEVKG
jgi:hypothetical protein